jgi:hypothetical protein
VSVDAVQLSATDVGDGVADRFAGAVGAVRSTVHDAVAGELSATPLAVAATVTVCERCVSPV